MSCWSCCEGRGRRLLPALLESVLLLWLSAVPGWAGFDPGPPDGTLGPKTREALRRYQHTKGLPATGELDAPTLDALGVR